MIWRDPKQMDSKLIIELAKEFGFPVVGDGSHIWFFRTQSGIYYYDFYVNHYIALGWDLIPVSMVNDMKKSYEAKREEISDLYPEEKRPGLILGQMDTFYNKMQTGDLIAIPAMGGKRIAIGILGDITSDIKHKYSSDEYEQCEYKHKRSVKWVKQIDLWTDVYFFRVLRAQQTISDITEYAEMVYRNLHPCYISENGLHLTLQKTTEAEFRIKNNIDLQSSILQINRTLTEYYGTEDVCEKITIKTAVGSPGFIEIILPYVPVSVMTGIFVYRGIVGKTKSSDGEENTGIMAILSKGNELLNDHSDRKKTAAEIKQIEANTAKTQAEIALVGAQVRKTNAEAESIEIENQKEHTAVAGIAESTRILKAAITQSGIGFDKKLDEVS